MPEGVIADLMVVLTTKTDQAVAGMAQVSAAGEEMAAKLTTSTTAVTAESERLGESLAMAGRAADGAAVQVSGASTAMSDSAARASAKLEQIGIASETAATENKLAMESMAAQTAALSAKLELAASKAAASNEAIGAAYKKADEESAKSGMGQAKNMGMAALAVGAVGAIAVDMAGKYETSTTRLVTSAGESEQAINEVRQGMLDMAGQVGVSAEKLSQGMYTVESAGYHGADGLKVLKAAAQGAKEEGADLHTVADAVSTALNDYHLPAEKAADVTSQLVTAVGQGKTTMEEFSGSLHNVTPLAASLHISLADVTGTLAEMTAHGMSADQASQNLAHTMRSLISPTSQQRDEFAQLGLSATDLSDHIGQRGISGTLQLLEQAILQKMGPSGKVLLNAFNQSKDAANNMREAISKMPAPLADLATKFNNGQVSVKDFTKEAKSMPGDAGQMAAAFLEMHNKAEGFTNAMKNGSPQAQSLVQALQRLTGTSDGLNTALMTTGENAAAVNDNVKKIGGAAQEAGGDVKGWHDIQATFNQKLDETKASLGALAVNLGNALLPVLKPVVDAFASFAGWLAKHPAIAKALAIALGVLTVAIVAMTVALWAASLTPITLIIGAIVAAVALVIVGIVALVTHWNQVWHAVGEALHAVYTAVIKPVIDAIVTAAKAVGNAFVWLWQNILKPVFDALSVAFRFVAMIWTDIVVAPVIIAVRLLGAIFSWLWTNAIKPAIDAIGVAWNWVYANAIKPVADFIGDVIHAVGQVFKWLWDNAIKPVVDAVSAGWNWLYNNVIRPVGEGIKIELRLLGQAWDWVWNNVIHPVIEGLSAAWHWVYDNAIRPVADFIGGAIHGVGQAFDDAFNWIKNVIQGVWNFVRPIFDAISGAIHAVGSALSGIGNTIASTFSGIGHFFGFDEGGWVPGAPGAPMLAVVHGGEYVLSQDMLTGRSAPDPKIGTNLRPQGQGTRAFGATGGGGGAPIVNVYVGGSVTTERALIDAVQTGILQAGGRRPVTYQNYRRG